MKVAVTGANGFLGRHVLRELAHRGVDTVAAVRSPRAMPADLPCERVLRFDIHDPPADCHALLGRPDVLIHLAWGGLPHYRARGHFESELPAHYRFLRNLAESGLSNLLVAGTCLEYGPVSGCLHEALTPRAHTPYGFAKDALRRQLAFLKLEHPFNLTWARLFYLYGEGQAESSLYGQLGMAVARGDKTFDMSGGEQLRDYLPVEVAAAHVVSLALARRDIGVINICSGAPISVRRLVEDWIRDNGWPIGMNLGRYPYPEHESMAFWGDRSKLSEYL